jgi:serine/threonine protein kinase
MDSPTLVRQLRELGLWPESEAVQREVMELQTQVPEARLLARELLQRELLTPYQANQLLAGKGEGLVIGGYPILEKLGEGGMGVVFKARHPRLHRIVALKIIRAEHVTNPVAVARFLREIRASAQLAHPNLVRTYDAGQVEQTYFYAMQFIDGLNLSRLVQKEGPLAVDRACDYALQAALGLQHIHEHGMVHRDIKPSNLMVTRTPALGADGPVPLSAVSTGPVGPWGQVKILDLGTARLCDETEETGRKKPALTKLGTIMGTADYMAPEQALASRHADIRSDIYSLGCTLYLMLTGQPPFPGGGAMEKIMRHQLDAPAPVESLRPGVPATLLALVRRMMAKKPEERFQAPAELTEALANVAASLGPVEAVPVIPASALPMPVALATRASEPIAELAFDGMANRSTARPPARQEPPLPWAQIVLIAGAATTALLVLISLLLLLR